MNPIITILYINFLTGQEGDQRLSKVYDLYDKLIPPLVHGEPNWFKEAQKFYMDHRISHKPIRPIQQKVSCQ